MANQAVHSRITAVQELVGRSHALLEERLIRIENALLADPSRATGAERDLMWQLLYGAVARFGLSSDGAEVAAIQLPLLVVPPNHTLVQQKDEKTGLVRISIVALDSAQSNPTDAVPESEPITDEAPQDLETLPDSSVPVEPPSGLVIEPQDVPFVDEDAALEAEMTAGVREE